MADDDLAPLSPFILENVKELESSEVATKVGKNTLIHYTFITSTTNCNHIVSYIPTIVWSN